MAAKRTRAAIPSAPAPGPTRWIEALVLAPLLLLTLWFQASVFFPRWTDETVHLYVARRVAQGAVLYRDIHSARPPLALAPLVAGLWAGVPPLWTSRGALGLSMLATATVLWWIGRRLFGPWQGLTATALFLLMPEVSARSAWTGIHLVALGALVCVSLAWIGRAFAAGLTGGLALAAGQHAALLVAGAALAVTLRKRADALRFSAGAAMGLAATFGVAALFAGPGAIWRDVAAKHLYHLKEATAAGSGDLGFFLGTTVLENLPWLGLAVLGALSPLAPAATPEARRTRWTLGALAAAHLVTVAAMSGGLVLYLFPAVPLVALLAADGLVRTLERQRLARNLTLTSLLAASLLVGWVWARARYQRRDAQAYALLPHLRLVEMARLQRLTVVERVDELIAPWLGEGDTVFGFPTLAAAVALDLNRRVAGELADLAPRWISMGLVSRKSVIETIEADHVRVFVAQANSYERDPAFAEYLARCYAPAIGIARAQGEGSGVPRVNVFRHLDGPCIAGPSSSPVGRPSAPERK